MRNHRTVRRLVGYLCSKLYTQRLFSSSSFVFRAATCCRRPCAEHGRRGEGSEHVKGILGTHRTLLGRNQLGRQLVRGTKSNCATPSVLIGVSFLSRLPVQYVSISLVWTRFLPSTVSRGQLLQGFDFPLLCCRIGCRRSMSSWSRME